MRRELPFSPPEGLRDCNRSQSDSASHTSVCIGECHKGKSYIKEIWYIGGYGPRSGGVSGGSVRRSRMIVPTVRTPLGEVGAMMIDL